MDTFSLKVKLFGLGGAGVNIVDLFAKENVSNVECFLLDTDAKAIQSVQYAHSQLLGQSICRGLGCGGDSKLAKQVSESHKDEIKTWINDSDVVIFVVGLGGGIGSALAQLLAELSTDSSAIIMGFCLLPFSFEGSRFSKGEALIGEIRPLLHGIFSIPNDYLLQEGEANQTALNGFETGNRWILNGIQSVSNLLFKKGILNQDFGTLKNIFQARGGKSLFAVTNPNEIFDSKVQSMESYIESFLMHPLLHSEDRPKKIDGLFIIINGDQSLGLSVIHQIASLIANGLQFKDEIKVDAYVDESLATSLSITLFAKSEIIDRSIINNKANDLFGNEDFKVNSTYEFKPKGNLKQKVLTLHKSKLRKKYGNKNNENDSQKEFSFFDKEMNRGYFTDMNNLLFKGTNLDNPTFLRKGIKIKHK